MMFRGVHIKKRYIALGVITLALLVKCSSGDDEYEQQQQAKPIALGQYQQNDGYQDVSRNDPATVQMSSQPQATQPIIINQQPAAQNNDSGFWHGMFAAHMMHSIMGNSGGRGGDYSSSHQTVVNKTYVTKNYQTTPAAPARVKTYTPAPVQRQTSSVSYSTPAPRTMTQTNGYSRSSYKSSGSSFKSSGFRSVSRSSSFRSRR